LSIVKYSIIFLTSSLSVRVYKHAYHNAATTCLQERPEQKEERRRRREGGESSETTAAEIQKSRWRSIPKLKTLHHLEVIIF
jgi:hypothetical protein